MDIISPERILRVSPLNVSEVLQNIQGTYVKDYGGFSALKSISLRGSSAAQVLLMLNGQRLNDPQTGEIDLSTLPSEGIERVEILRGGSSAMYGADAVGGVVNLITGKKQKSDGLDASLKIFGGSFNTNSYDGSLGFVDNWIKGSVGMQRVHSEGNFTYNDSVGSETQRENNDVSSYRVFSEFKFEFGDSSYKTHLDLNYRYLGSERGAPGSIEFPSLTARQWDTYQHFQTMLKGRLFSILNSYQINGFWHWNKSRFEETEGFFAADARNKSGNYGLETHARSVITPHHALTYGIGIRNEWMMSNQVSEDHNRQVYYLFIQNESNFDSKIGKFPLTIEVIPALRLDNYSDFGSRWSPKIGSGFKFGSELQTILKLNAGWSYRTPTFNQLYWPKSAWSSGNSDLKPESGFDWDLGLNIRYPKFQNLGFDVVYFDIRMKDLIQWQTDSQFFSMPVNVDKARNRGVEIKSSLQIIQDLVNINANYTYLDARNQSDNDLYNKFLVYRPRHSFNSTLNLIWQSLFVGLDYRYVGSRYTDGENNPEFELNPYDLLDFTIRFKPIYTKLQPTLVFQIKNIFNEQNDIIKNYPVPGREFRLSLELTYN
jgi:outer membrane receptor for ferrienterochelin and colicins